MAQIETPSQKARRGLELNPKRIAAAMHRVFGGDTKDAQIVLAWLADACHATDTVARGTPEETYRAIGRREVWLLIQDVLRVTEQDLRDVQDEIGGLGG